MIAMIRLLGRHRDLLYMLSRRDVTVKYKQSIMGLLWAILMPMLITSAGVVVKIAMAQMSGKAVVYYRRAELCLRRGELKGNEPPTPDTIPGSTRLVSSASSGPNRSGSITATGRAPIARMSRTMPPTPVAAPWYGSTYDGWLCDSTLKVTA